MTLLGDAAHPMLPFLGLGAAMAIEDSVVLSRAIAAFGPTPEALTRYQQARIGRTTRIFGESKRQGEIYQASDPDRYDQIQKPTQDRTLFDYDPVAVPL
jgi:salicylate hydroxylase